MIGLAPSVSALAIREPVTITSSISSSASSSSALNIVVENDKTRDKTNRDLIENDLNKLI
jgi:hypothetical protein